MDGHGCDVWQESKSWACLILSRVGGWGEGEGKEMVGWLDHWMGGRPTHTRTTRTLSHLHPMIFFSHRISSQRSRGREKRQRGGKREQSKGGREGGKERE